MVLRKGSGLHAAAGTAYFVSMLAMASSAVVIAAWLSPNGVNLVVAVLILYLVTTARVAARRRDASVRWFDRVAFAVVLVDGLTGIGWGLEAAASPRGLKDGMPAAIFFVFGAIALLWAVADARMMRRGFPAGAKRIVRHLGRMCLALLITLFSLYPGQAKLFPTWLRETNLLFVPHVLLLGALLFWIVRMRRMRKSALATQPSRAERPDTEWPAHAQPAHR